MVDVNDSSDITVEDILGDMSITVKEVSPKLYKHERNQRINKIADFNPSLMLCLHCRCKETVHCWNFKTRFPNPKKGNEIFHCEIWRKVTNPDQQPRQIRNKQITSSKLSNIELALIVNGLNALLDLQPIDNMPITRLIETIGKHNNIFVESEV
jgi:hypothetical protein